MEQCFGWLIWHDVPADGRFSASALVVCGACGEVFVVGDDELNERHCDLMIVNAQD